MSVFGVILVRIQSEGGKIRTRITTNKDTFHAVFALVAFCFKTEGVFVTEALLLFSLKFCKSYLSAKIIF